MNYIQRLIQKEIYRKSFHEFVKDFWNEADPDKFIDSKLIKFYCEVFQYMCRQWVGHQEINIELPKAKVDVNIIDIRNDKKRLNLNMPPRTSKSMIFNVLGPCWLWLFTPAKVASISHRGNLATKMNTKRQNVINSTRYKEISGIELISNSNSLLVDTRGGELYSISRDALTGYGGDLIINDDLTNAETARKDMEEMNNAWAYYQNTMPSRINNPKTGIIINIQQRLAPTDITGRILEDEKLANQYNFIVLPAIFEKETYIVCPISGEIIHYNVGDSLLPERFGNYEALKNEVGESVWQTQYLQNPTSSDKTIIKKENITIKSILDVPEIYKADIIYASHDFPVKDKESSDFLGSVLGYTVKSTLYILECLEEKMAFKQSVEYVKGIDNIYPGSIQIIEDKANGSPILQQLQDEVPGLQAFQPGTDSKIQRLKSASLYINNVVFVANKQNIITKDYVLNKGLTNLVNRLLAFPLVKHDDIVDAFSQLCLYVFMDKRFQVYGRSITDENFIDLEKSDINIKYSVIFFNKEGDTWKACEIGVNYGVKSRLVVMREIKFKATIDEGFEKLKEFGKTKNVFIDCNESDALRGMYNKKYHIERHTPEEFDKSVAQLNLAFSKKLMLIDNSCKQVHADIYNFKFSKTKDETVKYQTTKDGFVACLRVAIKHFGGIK